MIGFWQDARCFYFISPNGIHTVFTSTLWMRNSRPCPCLRSIQSAGAGASERARQRNAHNTTRTALLPVVDERALHVPRGGVLDASATIAHDQAPVLDAFDTLFLSLQRGLGVSRVDPWLCRTLERAVQRHRCRGVGRQRHYQRCQPSHVDVAASRH